MKNQQSAGKVAKTAVITLHAGGSTLTLLATRKPDGTAVTTATTRDADKHKSRGMTERHADMAAATAHLGTLTKKAEGLGWQRRVTVGKPDAFSALPAAPKAAPAGKK